MIWDLIVVVAVVAVVVIVDFDVAADVISGNKFELERLQLRDLIGGLCAFVRLL